MKAGFAAKGRILAKAGWLFVFLFSFLSTPAFAASASETKDTLKAVERAEQAVQADPKNTEKRLALATAYLDDMARCSSPDGFCPRHAHRRAAQALEESFFIIEDGGNGYSVMMAAANHLFADNNDLSPEQLAWGKKALEMVKEVETNTFAVDAQSGVFVAIQSLTLLYHLAHGTWDEEESKALFAEFHEKAQEIRAFPGDVVHTWDAHLFFVQWSACLREIERSTDPALRQARIEQAEAVILQEAEMHGNGEARQRFIASHKGGLRLAQAGSASTAGERDALLEEAGKLIVSSSVGGNSSTHLFQSAQMAAIAGDEEAAFGFLREWGQQDGIRNRLRLLNELKKSRYFASLRTRPEFSAFLAEQEKRIQ